MNDDHHELFALIMTALLISALAVLAYSGAGVERLGLGIVSVTARGP